MTTLTLRDLKPYPSAREQTRAMQRIGPAHDMPRAAWLDRMAREIQAERDRKARGQR